jgi:hypothetical protein
MRLREFIKAVTTTAAAVREDTVKCSHVKEGSLQEHQFLSRGDPYVSATQPQESSENNFVVQRI